MIYSYDGSLEGLLTTIFLSYKYIEKGYITINSPQIDLFSDKIFVYNDPEKAKRVKKSIIDSFGNDFYRQLCLVFLSYEESKDTSIARTLKGMYKLGKDFLTSSDKYSILFQQFYRNVVREIHSYKGLTRFTQIQDGYLFSEIEPENDILEKLTYHFQARLPKEDFIIFDKNRKKCSIHKERQVDFLQVEELFIEKSQKEEFYQEAWKEFYQSICIAERKNIKLMQNNMPKKYWKYLPEKNRF